MFPTYKKIHAYILSKCIYCWIIVELWSMTYFLEWASLLLSLLYSLLLFCPPISSLLILSSCLHLLLSPLHRPSPFRCVFLLLCIILYLCFLHFMSFLLHLLLSTSFFPHLFLSHSAIFFLYCFHSSSGRSARTSLNTGEKIEKYPEERLNISAHIYSQSQLSGGISPQRF